MSKRSADTADLDASSQVAKDVKISPTATTSKRSAEAAGLDASSQVAKDAKISSTAPVAAPVVVEDFLWTPSSFHYSVEEFMELIPQLIIRPPTGDDGKIWHFLLPLQPGFPVPEDKKELVANGTIKYQKYVNIAFDEKATTTGLKIWEPAGLIKNKSCSINFQATDLENQILGVEYKDAAGKMQRGMLIEHLVTMFDADPVNYFGGNDEMLADMEDHDRRKVILAKRYAKVPEIDRATGKPSKKNASSMPVFIGRATPNKDPTKADYKPGMKCKVSLNKLDMPDVPIYDKADVERAEEEKLIAEENGEKAAPAKPLYSQPKNLDPAHKDYARNLKISEAQPDPCALLPQWSKMYFSVTLLGCMINPGEFGIANRTTQFMRTALSSGQSGGERDERCFFLNKCKKPTLPIKTVESTPIVPVAPSAPTDTATPAPEAVPETTA